MKSLNSGHISKEVLIGLADGLEAWSKRKRRIVDNPPLFLSNLEDNMSFPEMEKSVEGV